METLKSVSRRNPKNLVKALSKEEIKSNQIISIVGLPGKYTAFYVQETK